MKYRLRLEQDTDAESPRDWDSIGIMACWHRRYNLGDEQPSLDPDEYLTDLARQAVSSNYPESLLLANRDKILEAHYVILPLYLYDHSGITMSTAPFSCGWDSGQVGIIYCSLKKALSEWKEAKGWGSKVKYTDGPITLREAITRNLKGEVETYDQFLTGDVYGYIVESFDPESGYDEEDDDSWETVDSCWGFFGEKYATSEGESILAYHREKEAENAKTLPACLI